MPLLTLNNILIGAAAALLAVLVRRASGGVFTPPENSLVGQTILITGGTTGLGLESAKRLSKAGASVIVTARSDEKGQRAVDAIKTYSKNGNASYKLLELDDIESCKAAAHWDLTAPIDVLLLNAGIMAVHSLQLTSLGVEKQFAVNHLGHFVFTASIVSKLSKSARVVVVSSDAHQIPQVMGGKFDLEYSWKPSESAYQPFKSYGMSKLANVYFASKLDEISPFTVVSLHPGAVATDLPRQLTNSEQLQSLITKTIIPFGKSIGIIRSVENGANTQVYLASTRDELVGGAYYKNMKPKKLGKFATHPATAEELWKQSEEISGVSFSF